MAAEPAPPDVYGVGQCAWDTLVRVPAHPEADAKVEFSETASLGGGPVATALVALARWGHRCRLAGVVGDDEPGARIRAHLAASGVDAAGLVTRPGTVSQLAFVAVEAETGRRTVYWRRPTGAPLRAGEIDTAAIRRSRVVHTDGLFAEASLAAARTAAAGGVPVVLDGGTLREGMRELAAGVDAAIVSESFARDLAEADDPAGACRELVGAGARLAVVTLGERGYVVLTRGEREPRARPAFPARAVDTTGCGDVFHAGYIHGRLAGWSDDRCLEYAAWTAARAAGSLGGAAGIPDAREFPV